MLDQQWKGHLVRVLTRIRTKELAVQAVIDVAFGQGVANQTGYDEQIDGEKFEKGGEDAALPGDSFVRGAQCSLNDVLVRAPIPQANNRRADRHSEPRKIPVKIPGNPMCL